MAIRDTVTGRPWTSRESDGFALALAAKRSRELRADANARAQSLGEHCGYCRADVIPLATFLLGAGARGTVEAWRAYLRGFAIGESRALRVSYGEAPARTPRALLRATREASRLRAVARYAREWTLDARDSFADEDLGATHAGMTDAEVIASAARHYDGGREALERDALA